MRDGHHVVQEGLQLEHALLNEVQVLVVRELLHGLVWQGRQHVAQVVPLHVLLDLRIQLSELAKASGNQWKYSILQLKLYKKHTY